MFYLAEFWHFSDATTLNRITPYQKMKLKRYFVYTFCLFFIACSSSQVTSPPKQGNFFKPRKWKVPIEKSEQNVLEQTKVDPPEPSAEPAPVAEQPDEQMIGYASWYGPGFQGNKTANGEVYDQNALTAAHKVLPMDTWVEVTNMENKKKVVVRINDRGPYKKNRIIDLSLKAADELEFIEQGTARVSLKIVDMPKDYDPKLGLKPYKQVVVQIAVFSTKERADSFQKKLSEKYTKIPFFLDTKNEKFYVLAGPYEKKSEAKPVSDSLRSEGIDNFIRSLKK